MKNRIVKYAEMKSDAKNKIPKIAMMQMSQRVGIEVMFQIRRSSLQSSGGVIRESDSFQGGLAQ